MISPYVLEEIRLGDSSAPSKRLAVSNAFRLLSASEFTEILALEYFKKSGVPKKSLPDCFHLAIAATNSVDYIVSWNFKHIANPNIRKIFRDINDVNKLLSPEISTPEEMLGEGE